MLDGGNDDAPPGVDERYTTAANARTLEVAAHHAGPVDVLAAAAWSPTRLGGLLLRLHSEYDGGQRVRASNSRAASRTETTLVAIRLRTLPQAREQLAMQAERWRIADPSDCARDVLAWWLDHSCPGCNGRRWLMVPDTPHLSGKACPACHGSGERAVPRGEDGRRVLGYVEDCLSRARDSIKHRLRGSSSRS